MFSFLVEVDMTVGYGSSYIDNSSFSGRSVNNFGQRETPSVNFGQSVRSADNFGRERMSFNPMMGSLNRDR